MKIQRVAVSIATVAAGTALMVGTAGADTYVGGEVESNTGSQSGAVESVAQTNSDPVLALTGTDVIQIAVAGVGLVTIGTVMARRSRKATQLA
jgi:LPXTG-motif cell wall-anchored protein